MKMPLQKGIIEDGKLRWEKDKPFEVDQEIQILNIANFCNECGNCATFCPTKSAPYLEKPKIYLTAKDFNEAHQGFYLDRSDAVVLKGKTPGREFSLTEKESEYIYREHDIEVHLGKTDFAVVGCEIENPKHHKGISLRAAAEMSVILKGAVRLSYS
jgi:putative selenate reductase